MCEPRPAFFSCVFSLTFSVFLSRSHPISIYSGVYFSGRKHALRKTAYLPNQTCDSFVVYRRKNLCSRQSFWNHRRINSTHSSTRKTPQRRALQITLQLKKMREFSRHRCCLTLNFGDNVNHSHSDRCQPLTDRRARVTQRSVTG